MALPALLPVTHSGRSGTGPPTGTILHAELPKGDIIGVQDGERKICGGYTRPVMAMTIMSQSSRSGQQKRLALTVCLHPLIHTFVGAR